MSLPHRDTRRSLMAFVPGGSCISSFSKGLIKLTCGNRNLKPIMHTRSGKVINSKTCIWWCKLFFSSIFSRAQKEHYFLQHVCATHSRYPSSKDQNLIRSIHIKQPCTIYCQLMLSMLNLLRLNKWHVTNRREHFKWQNQESAS